MDQKPYKYLPWYIIATSENLSLEISKKYAQCPDHILRVQHHKLQCMQKAIFLKKLQYIHTVYWNCVYYTDLKNPMTTWEMFAKWHKRKVTYKTVHSRYRNFANSHT